VPDLRKLLKPRSIAVVGVSPDRPLIGTRTYRNLRRHGFKGALYPINPRYEKFDEDRCWPGLSALPEIPDLVYIAIPAARCAEVVEDCAKLGVGAIEIASGGFTESGAEGAAMEKRIVAAAKGADIALCGPNNMGYLNYHDRIIAWPAATPRLADPGRIAVVTQSGSVGIVISQDERRAGLAYLVTSGNEAVLTASDYLLFFAEQENVSVILMFLETIREPRKFAQAAERARTKGKRIAVLKVGRSETGSRAVAAHTGAIAGEAALYDAFFRKHGILVARELDALIEMGTLLSAYPQPPVTPNVVPMTLSGGEAALLADLAAEQGVVLPELSPDCVARLKPNFPAWQTPRNPLDAYGLGWDAGRIEGMLTALAEEKDIGAIALALDAPASGGADAPWAVQAAEMCARLKDKTKAKFVFFNNTAAGGLYPKLQETVSASGIPYLGGMGHAFAAIGQWAALAKPQPPAEKVEPLRQAVVDRAKASETLTEPERFALMRDAGLPMSDCVAVPSADDAVKASKRWGAPIALKAGGPEILHKTELGFVRLGLKDEAAIREAHGMLAAKAGKGALVFAQPMIGPGIELILGARNDPGFGPAIVVGLGGTHVEVFKAATLRLAPIGVAEALAIVAEGPMGKLLKGVRGKGPYDMEAAARAVAAFSRFVVATESLFAAIEINPLIVLEKGAFGVDVVLEPR
jgi:acetate---CoA ligase (ADP-forming)